MAKTKEQIKLVRALFQQVQSTRAALESAKKALYVTDGNFRLNNASAIINLKTETSVNRLRDAFASLLELNKSKVEANKILGIVETSTLHMGASIAEWTQDFQTAVARINQVVMLRQVEEDERVLTTMDPSILADIKLEEMAKRQAAFAATQAQAGAAV